MRLSVSFEHKPVDATARAWARLSYLPTSSPDALSINDRDRAISADWLDRWLPRKWGGLFAEWEEPYARFSINRNVSIFKFERFEVEVDLETLVGELADVPFEVASFGYLPYPTSDDYAESDAKYWLRAPGPGGHHVPYGWGVAFQGAGHARLSSRRVLDHGPWKVYRGAHDTTLVQFFPLDAPADRALALAKVAHDKMGLSANGVMLGRVGVKEFPRSPIYDAANRRVFLAAHGERTTRIHPMWRGRLPVTEEPVTATDMRAARQAQVDGLLGDDKPIDAVGFVFDTEEAARTHLHELWIRGLETWVDSGGQRQRLDEDYAPKPSPPQWAR